MARHKLIGVSVAALAIVALPQRVLAAPPVWSEDGSAEAALLRSRAAARGRAELAQSVGTRGVTYEKDVFATVPTSDAGGSVVGPERPPDVPGLDIDDMRRSAELERIAKRGRSFFIPGIVLSTLGTIFVIGGIAGMAKEANGATIGITLGSVAVMSIGYPLMFVGVKMRKHPERYLGRRAQARIAPTGFSLRF